MGIGETLLAELIVGGAVFLLYRFLWKNRGHCPGCDQCQRGSRVKEGVGEWIKIFRPSNIGKLTVS